MLSRTRILVDKFGATGAAIHHFSCPILGHLSGYVLEGLRTTCTSQLLVSQNVFNESCESFDTLNKTHIRLERFICQVSWFMVILYEES